MKIYLLILMLVLAACSSTRKIPAPAKTVADRSFDGLKVYRIDSVDKVYLIYAMDKNQQRYKIMSAKDNQTPGELIKIGNTYNFMLYEYFHWDPRFCLVNATEFNETTVGIEEKNAIWRLYIAFNIRGLKIPKVAP
jgi:hypothetical protein